MVIFAVVCYAVLTVLCVAALFSEVFRDNWLQHCGLVVLGLFAPAKIVDILDRGYVSAETAMIAGALACYAIGTTLKVVHYRRLYRRP